MSKHSTTRSPGGSRPKPPSFTPFPAAYEPDPYELRLLRALWAKREDMTKSARDIVFSLLGHLQTRRLTEDQRLVAERIAARVGVVVEPPETPDPLAVTYQPWGALPKAPPGRRP